MPGCYFSSCAGIIVNKFRAGVQLARYSEGPSGNFFLAPTDPPQTAAVKIEENLEQILNNFSPQSHVRFFSKFKLTLSSNTSAKKLNWLGTQMSQITFVVSVLHIFLSR